MPYLNWKNTAVEGKISSHAELETTLELILSPEQARELGARLLSAFSEAEELRVDLPKNWAVFWKIREGESRLLLAHPQENEWVATLALEKQHAQKLTEKLQTPETGGEILLSEIGHVGGTSNVELKVCFR